jgi:8-oxo-dGTP pyrophosphatase MutT (NUDIX family)
MSSPLARAKGPFATAEYIVDAGGDFKRNRTYAERTPLAGVGLGVLSDAMTRVVNKALRLILGSLHRLLKFLWFVRRPRTFGAHALALTPERRIILVKLRYAPGWRLPGGGRSESEDPRDAVLRELREEIGMIAHGDVHIACELEERPDHKHDLASLLVVENVRYQPRAWSWEIEQIVERGLGDLPPDLAPVAARWLRALRMRIDLQP